jgi:hypothetical protein
VELAGGDRTPSPSFATDTESGRLTKAKKKTSMQPLFRQGGHGCMEEILDPLSFRDPDEVEQPF